MREIATPLRVGEEPKPLSLAPGRGEHTDDVLRELWGYDEERRAAVREVGAFGRIEIHFHFSTRGWLT